jgi:hypothetical protein
MSYAGLEALAGEEVPPLPAKASGPVSIIHYSLFIIHYSLFIIHLLQTHDRI